MLLFMNSMSSTSKNCHNRRIFRQIIIHRNFIMDQIRIIFRKQTKMVLTIIMFTLVISLSQCLLVYNSTITQTNKTITALSAGLSHLTLVVNIGSPSILNIVMYNLSQSSSTTIGFTSNTDTTIIKQVKGVNTPSYNTYIIQGSSGQVDYLNFTADPLLLYFGQTTYTCFGRNDKQTYMLQIYSGNCNLILITPAQNMPMLTVMATTCNDIGFWNNTIFAAMSTSSKIYINIYNTNKILLNSVQQNITQIYQNINLQLSNIYFCYSFGKNVRVLYHQNYSIKCNITEAEDIYDMKINDNYLYVSLSLEVKQYDIVGCANVGHYGTNKSMLIETVDVSSLYQHDEVFLWNRNLANIIVLRTTNSISANSTTNSTSTNSTSANSTTNSTSYSNISNINTTSPNNTNTPTDNSQSSNNFTQQTYYPPPPQISPRLQIQTLYIDSSCFQSGAFWCQVFCGYKCKSCYTNQTKDNCSVCSIGREQTDSKQCQLYIPTISKISVINFLSTFRFGAAFSFFFLIDTIELYQYHKITYDGIISVIFQQLNFFSNQKFNIAPLDFILDWTEQTFEKTSYNSFTNPKFLTVQRKDSLIFQTAKSYYIAYVPITFILFFFLNRVFFIMKSFKCSLILRSFSFWLYFLVIIVISNSPKISFYCFNHFKLMFSLNSSFKFLHAICLIFIGVFLIILLSQYFLSSYLYGKLHKYFLVNVKPQQFSLCFIFIRYSIRSLLQSSIHSFLYENGETQLIVLIFVQAIHLIFLFVLQMKFSLFKSKMVFACDFIFEFHLVLLNIILILKHYTYDIQLKVVECLEEGIISLIYVATSLFVFTLIRSLAEIISIFIDKKQEHKKKITIRDCYIQNYDYTKKIEEKINFENSKSHYYSKELNIKQKLSNQGKSHKQISCQNLKKSKQIYIKFDHIVETTSTLRKIDRQNNKKPFTNKIF